MIPVPNRDKFNRCIGFVLSAEGYWTNDPLDAGKLTIWGISSASFPDEVAKMKTMTEEQAKYYACEIYYNEFWLPLNCDLYDDRTALFIFNLGEACGVPTMQKWLAAYNQNTMTIQQLFLFYQCVIHRLDEIDQYPEKLKFLHGWMNALRDLTNQK